MAKNLPKKSRAQRTKKPKTQRNNSGTVPESTPPMPPSLALRSSKPSKIAGVMSLLQASTGTTIPQIVKATGWQPHTVRAALTGLRKRGYDVTSAKPDKSERRYRCTKTLPSGGNQKGSASTPL